MTDVYLAEDISVYNQKSLQQLLRTIRLSQGDFSLILVRCNSAILRENIQQELRAKTSIPLRELTLEPSTLTLLTTLIETLGQEHPQAVIVSGLEFVLEIDKFLITAKRNIEEFNQFSCPLILWVTDTILQKMIRLAPDFHNRSTSVEFLIETETLVQLIHSTVEDVFTKVLESRESLFLENEAFNLERGSSHWIELQSARKELEKRGVKLSLELEAGLEFVLGRVADHTTEESRQSYERSLELWRQSNNLEKQGHLLFYLGSWWLNYAIRHRAEYQSACQTAKTYLQQSLQVLKAANRLDLIARYINFLCEILQRLEEWEELEELVATSPLINALKLHRIYQDPFRKARAYGFLAEVELAKASQKTRTFSWNCAKAKRSKRFALKALEQFSIAENNLENSDHSKPNFFEIEQSFHRGWYFFSLGKSHKFLEEYPASIDSLLLAKSTTRPDYDPELYIGILSHLRESYFQKKDYLSAFKIKQEQQAIESQFGWRAFIGASQLCPQQQVANLTQPLIKSPGKIALELTASQRKQDLDYLIERMKRSDHKLTIIHGQSGVGKSSILKAGLIPAVQNKVIDSRLILPVLQQVYTNWVQELGQCLRNAFKETLNLDLSSSPLHSIQSIFDQLQHNSEQNITTLLIFDQFEELFFVLNKPSKRRYFYNFLKTCLDFADVKVILSLREDYLHYLLECNNRVINLDIVDNNILDERILYYLGNLKPVEAKSLIQTLTQTSSLHLENELIDQLVEDLAQELGEVRPIELQVVGSQLQTEQITTLKQYRNFGKTPKEKLVNHYLETVVKDCGKENKRAAELVLYLLTEENEKRPLKTRRDLERELKVLAEYPLMELEKLNLVLDIFVQSGLVVLLQHVPEHRYQLVHDYMVQIIRQREGAKFISDLAKERVRRKRLQKGLTLSSVIASVCMAILTGTTIQQNQQLEAQKQETTLAKLNTTYQLLRLVEDNKLDAAVKILRAGMLLQAERDRTNFSDIQQETLQHLWQAVYFTPERNRLENHQDSVLSVSTSADGQLIASASSDQTIKLWSPAGVLYQTLTGHRDTVWCVSFSPDTDPNRQILASASKDKTLKLWDRNGQLITTLLGHQDEVKWVSFSPDGSLIASASQDQTVKLWNRQTGALVQTLRGHQDSVLSVSFSPDGAIIASSSKDKTIKLWNRQGQLIDTLTGHQDAVWSVSFSPDGQTLASGSDDYTIKLWKRQGTTYKISKTLKEHQTPVNSVSFSPDGTRIASASSDGEIKLWANNGILVSTLVGHGGAVNQVGFAPNGKILVSGSSDASVRTWSTTSISPKVFQPDYKVMGVGGSFSPDGTMIATPSEQNTFRLWSPQEGTRILTVRGHQDRVTSVSFSDDGTMIASGSLDRTVRLWQSNGKPVRTLTSHQDVINDVEFSPETDPQRQVIASASQDQTVKVWSREGKLLYTLRHDDSVTRVSFSPDGEMLASVSRDKTLRLWRRADGSLIDTLEGDRKFSAISFSPTDNHLIAAATDQGAIKLWQLQDDNWQEISTDTLIGAHKKAVYQISFSKDGQILASASEGGTVKIWDRQGTLLLTLQEGANRVEWVGFSPVDQLLVAIDATNRVSVWNVDFDQLLKNSNIDQLLEQACDQIGDYLKHNPKVAPEDKQLC